MNRRHRLFAFLSAFLAAAALAAEDPALAPEGYSWKKLDEIKA